MIRGSSRHVGGAAKPAIGSRRGKLAAAGVAAVAATGVAAASAQASGGRLYACYSKSSHVMRYSKGSRCARGSKSLSWSTAGPQGAQGPEGPQGAQGAQGPAGETAAFAAENSNLSLVESSNGSYGRVVADYAPSQAGLYVVNAANTLENEGGTSTSPNFAGCWVSVASSSSNDTPPQFVTMTAKSQILPVGVTGAVFASASHPVKDICLAGEAAHVREAAVEGVLADEVDGDSAARPLRLEKTSPRQLFRKALAAHRAELGQR